MSSVCALRACAIAGLVVTAALVAEGAQAQAWPSKPIRWFIPFPPGGGTDILSRVISQRLAERLGVAVLAENRPGSGGTIGLEAAARAPGDGYNLVMGQAANLAIAPTLYRKLSYDPVKDFAPITNAVSAPSVLVVHPSLPVKTVKELAALARAKPDALTFGSPGNGTTGHLAGEQMRFAFKAKMLHVPYKGNVPAMTDLLGGQITMLFSTIPPVIGQINSGKLRAIATTGDTRAPVLKSVPTMVESGFPDFVLVNWWGVLAPAGTPKEIIGRLNAELLKILQLADVRERIAAEGGEPSPTSPEQFARFIASEITRWGVIVKASGATVD
jgi:tripartite-type tricarboxylate transporter receptor subunit TctC